MDSLDVSSRQKIQTLKEASAKGLQPQPTKGWAVTEEVFDSLQLLLITRYRAIVLLLSVPNSYQRSNLAVSCDISNN